MKNIRYIFATLIFLLAGTLFAQVAEFHLNESWYGEPYISKYYLSDYDSIVYIPAQDWSISAEIDSCYEDEASHEAHVIVTITVGPNADVARAGFGDVRNAVAPYVELKKGTTQTLDLVIPEKDKTCTFGMYTMNNYHTFKSGDYYYGDYYNSITVNYKEWQERLDWNDIGIGRFYDGFQDDYLWDVTIQQSKYNHNLYRVLNPYKGMWKYYGEPSFAEASSNYLEFRILEKGEELGGVEITKDGLVYFEPVNSGYFHSSYNDYIWAYHPSHFSIASEELYANNYVAKYKEDGTPGNILIAPYYYIPEVGGWNYTNDPGMIEIRMPGYIPKYYDIGISYIGEYSDAEGNQYVTANIDYLGEDAAKVQLVITAGRNNAQAGIDAILSGAEGVVTATSRGAVNVPMPANAKTGNYTVTAVTFDSDGNAQEYGSFTFLYKDPNQVPETWTQIGVGTYTYSQFFEGDDVGLEIFQSEDDLSRFKIGHWGYDVDFIFTMNENNEISFDEFYVGYTDASYGEVIAYDMNALYPSDFPVGYYADGVFHFQIGYGVDAGWFGYGEETFTITSNAEAKTRTTAKSPIQVGKTSQSIPSKLNIKQPNGKKVQRVHRSNAGSRADKPTQIETPRIPLLQSTK